MSAALIILLVSVASGAPEDGAATERYARGVEQAVRQALGPEASVVSRQVPTEPSDARLLALGAEVHADVVAEVSWSGEYLSSKVRLERVSEGEWLDRDLAFRSVDEPRERSRAVGLAIASMLPEFAERLEHASAEGEGGDAAPPRPSDGDGSSDQAREETSAPEPPVEHRRVVSVVAQAAIGTGAGDRALGGLIDYRDSPWASVAFRLAVGGRLSQDAPAEVGIREYSLAGGLAWTRASSSGRARLGLRGDALAILEQFEPHVAAAGGGSRFKLIPAADLVVEGTYFFSRAVAVALGAGAEARFGTTEVFVGGRRVARLAPLYPVVEAGFRLGF